MSGMVNVIINKKRPRPRAGTLTKSVGGGGGAVGACADVPGSKKGKRGSGGLESGASMDVCSVFS